MNVDYETAQALKISIRRIFEDKDNEELLEFLEELGGKYCQQYDPELPESLGIAHGKAEVIQTLRNINRLTEEQIVQLYAEGTQ